MSYFHLRSNFKGGGGANSKVESQGVQLALLTNIQQHYHPRGGSLCCKCKGCWEIRWEVNEPREGNQSFMRPGSLLQSSAETWKDNKTRNPVVEEQLLIKNIRRLFIKRPVFMFLTIIRHKLCRNHSSLQDWTFQNSPASILWTAH